MNCKHCGLKVIGCGCHMHPPPMWKHQANGFHRCGRYGTEPTYAEPWTDEEAAAYYEKPENRRLTGRPVRRKK